MSVSHQSRRSIARGDSGTAERALRRASLLAALALAPACARAIIYTTADAHRGGLAPALVDARNVVGRYRLVATSESDPSQESRLCSAPTFEVREDAAFVELPPGSYDLHAHVSPAGARTFFPFGIEGRVTLEAGHCYSPVITCEREQELDWEQTCRLVLRPRSCSAPWYGRRVLMRSSQDC